MKNYLSIDIGGTIIKYGIVSDDDSLTQTYETKTDNHLGGAIVQTTVLNLIQNMIEKYKICGVCISTAGIVNPKTGVVIEKSPLTNNFGPINFKQIVQDNFNLPCEIENDVNCAALAELYAGSSKNSFSSLCLTIGTGIGGSFILNNQILQGFSHSSCEVGYMQIDGYNFQDIASTTALIQNVSKRTGLSLNEINGKFIFDKANSGDEVYIQEIDKLCDYLGKGIANICCVLNPQIVVLGGGIMEQGESLRQKVQESVKKYLIPIIFQNTTIVIAKNGNKAGMLGAYYNFKNNQFKEL